VSWPCKKLKRDRREIFEINLWNKF
jgi:hypothetical protein